MMVFSAQEASDLCGIPYASLMNYAEKWPWLVYRDKDREINPELTRGLPRAYVPRGFVPLVALIRLAYECGQTTEQVNNILRAFYWPRIMSGSQRLITGSLIYYPATDRAEIVEKGEGVRLDTMALVFPLGHLYRMMERARAQEGAGRLVAGPVASRLTSELTDAFDAFCDD